MVLVPVAARGGPYAGAMLLPLTVVPVPGHGAEDVLVGEDGRVWTGTADGGLHVHDPTDGSVTTVTTTGGRPLGLEWLPDGHVLMTGPVAVSFTGVLPQIAA